MTIDQLAALLLKGMHDTFDLARRLNDDPDLCIKPEYLKTVKMSEALLSGDFKGVVRLEQSTSSVVGMSALPPRDVGFANLISRAGKVDIVVCFDSRPIVIVEIKLYVSGFSRIKDDVIRCCEFLSAENKEIEGSIAAAAVTFFWRERRGVTKLQQKKSAEYSLDGIEQKASRIIACYNFEFVKKQIVMRESPYDSMEDSEKVDDNGVPADIFEEPITVYAVAYIIFRKDRDTFLQKLQSK